MTKKVPKKILRIERNFFVNLRKQFFGRPRRARRRRRRFFWTGGAPPPPTEIDRRAAADTMTSAHSYSRPLNCLAGQSLIVLHSTAFSLGYAGYRDRLYV